MEIILSLPQDKAKLLVELVEKGVFSSIPITNARIIPQTDIRTKWVITDVVEPIESANEDRIRGVNSDKPCNQWVKKWNEAESSLSIGNPKYALKIIGEMLADMRTKFKIQDSFDEVYKTYILGMAKFNRLEIMYNLGQVNPAEYLQEIEKLDNYTCMLLEKLKNNIMGKMEVIMGKIETEMFV